MKVDRRKFLTMAGAGAASVTSFNILTERAKAAEFQMKYASEQDASHPMTLRTIEAVEAIKKETNGAVEIQVFAQSLLGSGPALLSQIRSGAIDFLCNDGFLLEQLVPGSSAYSVGFAFKDYPQVWAAMDGGLGAHLRKKLEPAGIYAFEKMWDNGFRQITSSRTQITSPENLKGFKIRIPVGQLLVSLFEGLGASPVTLGIKDVYTALQTNLADGQENSLATINFWKFNEVQKHCALTNHMWGGFWVMANARSWNRLPPAVQAVVAKNWNLAAEKERADLAELATTLKSSLEAKGLAFNTVDQTPFRETLRKAGFFDTWQKKFGPETWSQLEKYAGTLG